MKRFDFVVVGGGAGGCAAALLAARLNQKVALVEAGKLGGASLHTGCTPTKSMLVSARYLRRIQAAVDYGVTAQEATGTLADFLTRQRNVVSKIYQSLLGDLDQAGVAVFKGQGMLTGEGRQVLVKGVSGSAETIEGRRVILAPGGRPVGLEGVPCDGRLFLNSDQILHLTELPGHLAVVGDGYIPCEYASIFSALGCKVTVVGAAPQLLPKLDPAAGKFLQQLFPSMGIEVWTGAGVVSGRENGGRAELVLSDGRTLAADKVLVAVGREPQLEGLGLEAAGVRAARTIQVDSRMETSVEGIYAVGDANGLCPLAHAAVRQGRMAVLNALGDDHRFVPQRVPVCIYTTPEIGAAGWTEVSAREAGYDVATAQVPFSEVGRAVAMGELTGFVKLIADRSSHRLLGGVIIGGQAAEMVMQIAVALEMEATVEELAGVVTAHPSLSEAVQEAVWNLFLEFRRV
jgi:dihydrolipoamide dehydrogenase